MKDIEIIDIDYSAKDPAFKKEDKVIVAKISGPWIIPEEGPIYADSVRVLKGGLDLIPGTDFEPVEEVTDLTLKTGKKVCLYVKLKQHIITANGELDMIYQRVGLPIISTKKLMQTLEDMVIKGKPVDWDTGVTNKPKTYYPSWHSHDIKNSNEMVGFGGLVELFSHLTWEQGSEGTKMQELLTNLQTEMYDKLDYIHKLKWAAIMSHSRNYNNPHGVQKSEVGSGNIDNLATATPQEDSEAKRDDLRSTPAGLARLISEQSPETEDYLVQNELPFGYYGSGIYLPPPITGSFEGLGADIENSMFVREGNGWTVGLIRGYDGRVKNLYYIYTEDILDRTNQSPWIHTYVKYEHNAFTAIGKTPNITISGSNNEIMCVGDCDNPNGHIDRSKDVFFIALTNTTLDPGSHTMKPINLGEATANPPGGATQPGQISMARVGPWVYFIQSCQSHEGDVYAQTAPPGAGIGQSNYQQRFFRFPYADLENPAVTSITLTRVNVSFDNLDHERRNNLPAMYMIRHRHTTAAIPQLTEAAIKYTRPIKYAESHRRRQYIVVQNPNNPRYARVRVCFVTWNIVTQANGGEQGLWQDLIVDYEWDGETNTWTIDPTWKKPTLNVDTNQWVDINMGRTYSLYGVHTSRFVYTSGSWVPGIGYVSVGSLQTGVPPFNVGVTVINRDGDPLKDYEWMAADGNWWDAVGRQNTWGLPFIMKSPFGVAGFPRFHNDIYQTVDGLRSNPIEIFFAENEQQNQQCFYRITEPDAADNNYDYRDTVPNPYIPRPMYRRKTNSSFGIVDGQEYNVGSVNRPRRKDKRSRECGLFGYIRRNMIANPGAINEFTWRINDNGKRIEIPIEDNGDIIINTDMDYRYDVPTKILFVRPNKAKQVRVPRSVWQTMVNDALYLHAGQIVDMGVSFYISAMQGSGGDQPFSMWSVHYHLASDPSTTRSIIGMFTWTNAGNGPDGLPTVRVENMQYPFKQSWDESYELRPGYHNNITQKSAVGWDPHSVTPNGSWANISYWTGLMVKYQHMEILDFESEGPQNLEQVYQPGLQVNTPGNASTPVILMRRRGNVIVEAKMHWAAGQAFNTEYSNQIQANPQWGWIQGVSSQVSGGAIDLMQPWNGPSGTWGVPVDKYIMLGATYVEGNWSVFINSEVTVTFNGFSMMAKMQNWDLRDLTDDYKDTTFYIYCCANGSGAYYEITKVLRNHDPNKILVATILTEKFGIYDITTRQTFTISGFPITLKRDMGVPASSGAVVEAGSYSFIKRSELFSG